MYRMFMGHSTDGISIFSYDGFSSGRPSLDVSRDAPPDADVADGRAIEVVELANGEVIWSVLDSLRAESAKDDYDDDAASGFFAGRQSFDSRYSVAPPTEGFQMTFRHHQRSGSRQGTPNEYLRSPQIIEPPRPETKV